MTAPYMLSHLLNKYPAIRINTTTISVGRVDDIIPVKWSAHTSLIMHVVASVQARLGSTRLPGKVLFHLGDKRLLQWTYDQTVSAKTIDASVVSIGDEPENEAVTEYCERTETNYIVGPEDDLLARHFDVAEKTGCDLLVRVTADCPFVPSTEIDRVVRAHAENDAQYTTNITDDMPIGTAVDVVDVELLRELREVGETHPVKLAREKPDEWGVVWDVDDSWGSVADAHMAVDTPKDYWSLVDALDAVGDSPREIAEWLTQQKDLS